MVPIDDDPRIDPRLKELLAFVPSEPSGSGASRDELVARASTPEARLAQAEAAALLDAMDDGVSVPTAGLDVSRVSITSSHAHPIDLAVIRPQVDGPLPCVYYLHGGGMATMSCFDGVYRVWGRRIAHHGVVVVMVDFRNCLVPSSASEVAPYPAGLDDCVTGLRWVHAHAATLGIDPDRIVVAGESGGGNLTLATGMRLLREGGLELVRGLYALCPYLAGDWPQERFPSSTENNGIFLDVHGDAGRVRYGIEAFEARDPLAWPSFATEADVVGLPPTFISVNECDPLRDEGIEFYRLLLRAGVLAQCRQVMGTIHGAELIPIACPEVSEETAASIARFARTV